MVSLPCVTLCGQHFSHLSREQTGQNSSLPLKFCGLKPPNLQERVHVCEGYCGRQGREP